MTERKDDDKTFKCDACHECFASLKPFFIFGDSPGSPSKVACNICEDCYGGWAKVEIAAGRLYRW